MKPDATALLEAALRLPAEARAAMAATLLESLDDEVDPDAEAAWAVEIERRLREYREGKARSVPWSEARRRILSGA
jgi:putative addiction module component (TIGR02574 family)